MRIETLGMNKITRCIIQEVSVILRGLGLDQRERKVIFSRSGDGARSSRKEMYLLSLRARTDF